MAFSIGRTWSESITLLRERWAPLLVVAVAIQTVAFAVVFPMMSHWLDIVHPMANPDAEMEQMMQILPQVMGLSMLANLLQLAGWGTMVELLGPNRPKVDAAVVVGLKATPTMLVSIIFLMIGCYIGLFLVILVFAGLIGGIAATQGGNDSGAIGGMIVAFVILYFGLIAGALYVGLRFVTLVPVAVIERQYNPFTVVTRSWKLSAGNGWKIVGFWLLLWVPLGFVLAAAMLTMLPSMLSLNGDVPDFHGFLPFWIAMVPFNIVLTIFMVTAVVSTHRQLVEEPLDEAS